VLCHAIDILHVRTVRVERHDSRRNHYSRVIDARAFANVLNNPDKRSERSLSSLPPYFPASPVNIFTEFVECRVPKMIFHLAHKHFRRRAGDYLNFLKAEKRQHANERGSCIMEGKKFV